MARNEKNKDTSTSQTDEKTSSTWSKRTFAASMVFVVVLAVCFVYVAGPGLWDRMSRSSSAPATTVSAAVPTTTTPAGAAQSEAGSSVCGLAPGSQNLPSGPFEQRMIPVSTTWGVPEVKDIGPGITTGITRCFAHSPSGAVVASVNFIRWFSSQDRLPDVVRTLMVDDANRQRMLNQIQAGWDGVSTQPLTIRGYRAEVRSANQVLVTLVVSTSPMDDRMVSMQLLMVWEGGDWKAQAPSTDSWGQELVDSLTGFSPWTVK